MIDKSCVPLRSLHGIFGPSVRPRNSITLSPNLGRDGSRSALFHALSF